MITREPSHLGSGVFRRLIHQIDVDAYVIDFRGVTLFVARCGAVAVPFVRTMPERPLLWCSDCRKVDHGSIDLWKAHGRGLPPRAAR